MRTISIYLITFLFSAASSLIGDDGEYSEDDWRNFTHSLLNQQNPFNSNEDDWRDFVENPFNEEEVDQKEPENSIIIFNLNPGENDNAGSQFAEIN